MSKYFRLMQSREEEIAKMMDLLSQKTKGFEKPKMVLVGGYALRAFVPYSRATRDCDFVLQKQAGWIVERISKWKVEGFDVDSFEKRETYAFLKLIKRLSVGKHPAQVSVDFMEGEVRGRNANQIVLIDDKFVSESNGVDIAIAGRQFKLPVPTYADYFILKIVSSRPSDIRDIATLAWKKGLPEKLAKRVKEIVPHPEVVSSNISSVVIPAVSDDRFVHSWRGTFATTEFDEKARRSVVNILKKPTG